MKNLSLTIGFVLFTIFNSFSQTDISGAYFSNELWTKAKSPYRVVGHVQLASGYTLTIEPGVIVEFTGPYEIISKGSIIANGNSNDSIRFICSPGVSAGVAMIKLLSVNLNNSSFSYISFTGGDDAMIIDNSCSNKLLCHSMLFKATRISMLYTTPNANLSELQIKKSKIVNSFVKLNPQGNSAINIDSSGISDSDINISNEGLLPLKLSNSVLTRTKIHCQSFYKETSVINNCFFRSCKFSTYYAITTLNSCKIIDSGFDNFNGPIKCQVFFNLSRSFVINTSIQSSATNYSGNLWSTEMNIDRCIIQKGPGTILGMNEGIITRSIIIGNNSGYGIIGGSGGYEGLSFANSTIINNDIGIRDLVKKIASSNIFNNKTYNVKYNGTTDVSAHGTYWGDTTAAEIINHNYDYYDNISLGELLFYPDFLKVPSNDCPISPPANFKSILSGTAMQLSWNPNPEQDIKGYKIYYGHNDGFTFQHVIEVGNVTSYSLPIANIFDTIAVTAFDFNATNNNDMIEGHESWYSFVKTGINLSTLMPLPENMLSIFPNPAQNRFNIILSAHNDALTYNLNIYDIKGMKVKTLNLNSNLKQPVDISDFLPGIYFLKIEGDNYSRIVKLIKI